MIETKQEIKQVELLEKTKQKYVGYGQGIKTIILKDTIGMCINAFLKGEERKFGNYKVTKNKLSYMAQVWGEQKENIVAIRLKSGMVLGNASILSLIGRKVAYGTNERMNRYITEIQTRLTPLIPMLPFNVFQEAKLDIEKLEILEEGPEENVIKKFENINYDSFDKKSNEPKFIEEKVHFTGAKLFAIKDTHFLFDIDRNEIKHKIFNAFLVKLPSKTKTISEAYQSLKPKAVLQAEKNGVTVLRQGEWFLIPTDKKPTDPKARAKIGIPKVKPYHRFVLQAGFNRPNEATKGFKIGEKSYISGTLEHSGREHKNLILKKWYFVVPNTATKSFTIEGDID